MILSLRQLQNLSLEGVGAALEIAAPTVFRCEMNVTPLSDYVVSQFAEVYEVDPEQLMLAY